MMEGEGRGDGENLAHARRCLYVLKPGKRRGGGRGDGSTAGLVSGPIAAISSLKPWIYTASRMLMEGCCSGLQRMWIYGQAYKGVPYLLCPTVQHYIGRCKMKAIFIKKSWIEIGLHTLVIGMLGEGFQNRELIIVSLWWTGSYLMPLFIIYVYFSLGSL